MRITVTGLDSLVRKLRKMPEEVAKTTEEVVKMTAVKLCVEYGRATGPSNMLADKPITDYQNAVEKQIRRVFLSSENPSGVAAVVKRRSEKLYRGYLRAVREGKTAQARRYLREAGITVDELSRAAHQAARTGTGRSVPKDAQPAAVVNAAKLRVYVREERQRVGMAKAAWFQAAQGLVKRVRGSAEDGTGGRRSFQRFPALVRKVAKRYPGLGYAQVLRGGMAAEVKIASTVDHGADAADMAAMAAARVEASAGLRKAIELKVAALSKRIF